MSRVAPQLLVTINTGSHEFATVAPSLSLALTALREAYATHVAQSEGLADPDLMAELLDAGEFNASLLWPGTVVRDHSPIERTRVCVECGEPVTDAEAAAIAEDRDFIEHGDRGHLIRYATPERITPTGAAQ